MDILTAPDSKFAYIRSVLFSPSESFPFGWMKFGIKTNQLECGLNVYLSESGMKDLDARREYRSQLLTIEKSMLDGLAATRELLSKLPIENTEFKLGSNDLQSMSREMTDESF